MLIGEVAKQTGTSVRSLRHYDAQGLIKATRLPNGYREYSPGTVERVGHIKTLLNCGFSLREIQSFPVCERIDTNDECKIGLDMLSIKKAQIEKLIASLELRRDTIVTVLSRFWRYKPPLSSIKLRTRIPAPRSANGHLGR